MQGQTKIFKIQWKDENLKQPLIQEIEERPTVQSNHKKIKSSSLKSSLKNKSTDNQPP